MKYLLLIAALFIAGCDNDPLYDMQRYQEMRAPTMSANDSNRFVINRVAVFQDNLAYDGKRGIYIIKDVETGVEYVGVSGIGISELGSHTIGKSTNTDER